MNALRLSFRQFARNPGLTALSVLILSLGIAGNTVVFSILNGMYLRPLPVREPSRLVDLDETAPRWNLKYTAIAYPDFVAWRNGNRTFEGMGVWSSGGCAFTQKGDSQRISGLRTSHDLATVLGYQPILGRAFSPQDDQPGAPGVVLLGHGFWQRVFAGQTDILGQELTLDGQSHTVIGVLPKGAAFPEAVDVWRPLQLSENDTGGWFLSGIGRLKDGVGLSAARTDLEQIHRGMIETRKVNAITSPTLMTVRDRYFGEYRLVTGVLLVTVGLVLVIACANVASLMLARGLARCQEMGIRLSLGATRWQVAQQVLAESLALAAVGSAAGMLLGTGILKGVLAWIPERLPAWVEINFDFRLFAFCSVLTFLAAGLFGMLPALQAASGRNILSALAAASNRVQGNSMYRKSLGALVAGEIALALVLLVTAGLLGKALFQVHRIDPGFRAENLLAYSLELPDRNYPQGQDCLRFFESHLEKVRSLPGVTHASAITAEPLGGHWGNFYEPENAPAKAPDAQNPVILKRVAYSQYLETLGIQTLSGRSFTDDDGRAEGTKTVIVNEILTEMFWPGQPAIGKRIRPQDGGSNWLQVVGVVKDVKHYGLDQPMRPGVYVPAAAEPPRGVTVLVRTSVEPLSLVPTLRDILRQSDQNLPMDNIRTMKDRLERSLWVRRFYSWSVAVVAGVALILAIGGIYGVTSYASAQRTGEFGIRMALGADQKNILVLVLKQGMRLAGAGLALGLVASLASTPLLRSLLFGTAPLDPITFLCAGIALSTITLAACLVPALRATRVDPAVALRCN
jgi:predicted permease